jgi:hypothetical protein
MARHRKDYAGERLTAQLTVQFTPADRAALEAAAAEIGMRPADFTRHWVLNGIRSVEASQAQRKAQRATDRELAETLIRIGHHLNTLAHMANETQEIESERAIAAVSHALVTTIGKIEPVPRGQACSSERRALLVEVSRIGNNIVQLKRIARHKARMGSVAALEQVETQIIRSLDLVTPA